MAYFVAEKRTAVCDEARRQVREELRKEHMASPNNQRTQQRGGRPQLQVSAHKRPHWMGEEGKVENILRRPKNIYLDLVKDLHNQIKRVALHLPLNPNL